MIRINVILLSLLLSMASLSPPPPESLKVIIAAKKWQRRVLLIYARDSNNADLLAQQQLLTREREGLNERDFDQIVVLETNLSAADRQFLQGGDRKLPAQAMFMTWLIGKDGGVKQRFSQPVAPAAVFRIVDAMPMRQSEMRRN